MRVETNLYVVNGAPDGELVWTGITDTFNPSNVHKAIKGLVDLVVTKCRRRQYSRRDPELDHAVLGACRHRAELLILTIEKAYRRAVSTVVCVRDSGFCAI
jgi:hypothetical protein